MKDAIDILKEIRRGVDLRIIRVNDLGKWLDTCQYCKEYAVGGAPIKHRSFCIHKKIDTLLEKEKLDGQPLFLPDAWRNFDETRIFVIHTDKDLKDIDIAKTCGGNQCLYYAFLIVVVDENNLDKCYVVKNYKFEPLGDVNENYIHLIQRLGYNDEKRKYCDAISKKPVSLLNLA